MIAVIFTYVVTLEVASREFTKITFNNQVHLTSRRSAFFGIWCHSSSTIVVIDIVILMHTALGPVFPQQINLPLI